MIEKVVYIGYQPITEQFYNDYYVGICLNNGLKVEFWDISYIYFPGLEFEKSFDFPSIKYIKSFAEIRKMLSLNDLMSTIFITNITYEFRVCRFFLLLSSLNCTQAAFGRGMFPIPTKTEVSKILGVLFSFDFRRMYIGLKNRIATLLKYFQIVKTYNYIFLSGSEGYKTLGFGNNLDIIKAKVIDVNYFDYDKYLSSLNGVRVIEKNYCVFLDEYLPYHPDIAITGIKTIEPGNYYSDLNKFFNFVEMKTNLTVVIAAHPKAVKYKSENPFDGRIIVFNKTCELVRNSSFVMTHHSTSISFPILFKKPIFFITSSAQKKTMSTLYELTCSMADFLNSKIIDFDDFDENENLILFADIEKYDDYKYRYLTSKNSENKNSSEIFIETIKKLG